MIVMASMLSLAVFVPYLYYRYAGEHIITFPFAPQILLQKRTLLLVAVAAVLSYFLIPFYFSTTGAWQNWPDAKTSQEVLLLFIGTNALGIWDELFFINTLLTILKRHFRFWIANAIQATFFTFFLYELGFTGWLPLVIYPFALLQGYIFRTYKSLALVIAILHAHGNLPFRFFI